MTLEVIEAGALTTVQDLGRPGAVKQGVPAGGAMDPFALQAANCLVGNDWGAAGLEITVVGPKLVAREPCVIAVAGANPRPRIDGDEVAAWKAHLVRARSLVDFVPRGEVAGARPGARAYLAVSGGIATARWQGSRSAYLAAGLPGLLGRAVRAGDRLPIGESGAPPAAIAGMALPEQSRPDYAPNPTVHVILGPHVERFTEQAVETFLAGSYEVTAVADRMGYRLRGPRLTHAKGPDIVSCGVPLGGIQVPGDGQPIVLMADHQTVGGYTMIATVIQADIPLVAQCMPGDRLRFRAVTLEEARGRYRRLIDALRALEQEKERYLWTV